MKTKRIPSILVIFVLLGITLACDVIGDLVPAASDEDTIATSVAETVDALAVEISSPPTTLPDATATPEIMLTPETDTFSIQEGLTLAYTDGERNLWVWTEEGTASKLVSSGDVSRVIISDDGTMIAFLRSQDFQDYSLWVIDIDGANERQLISTDEFFTMAKDPAIFEGKWGALEWVIGGSPYPLKWVPAEHTLAFVNSPQLEGPGLILADDLWLVNADTGERKLLLPPGKGGAFYYSPDGAQIAVVTPEKITLVNSDGSNYRDGVFRYEPVITYSEYMYYVQPLWAADSTYLRVVVPPSDPMLQPAQSSTVWQILTDGSPAIEMCSVLSAPFIWPILSPDLSKVAYLAEVGSPGDAIFEFHIANVDGSGDILLQTGQLRFIGWGSDSTHFLVGLEEGKVHLGGISGDEFIPLGDDESIFGGVEWIDSEKFLFLSRSSDGWKIYLASIDGSKELIVDLYGSPDDSPPNFDLDT